MSVLTLSEFFHHNGVFSLCTTAANLPSTLRIQVSSTVSCYIAFYQESDPVLLTVNPDLLTIFSSVALLIHESWKWNTVLCEVGYIPMITVLSLCYLVVTLTNKHPQFTVQIVHCFSMCCRHSCTIHLITSWKLKRFLAHPCLNLDPKGFREQKGISPQIETVSEWTNHPVQHS